MKKLKIIMISLAVLLGGCHKKTIIHQINVDVLKHHKDTIDLNDYTDFDWDRALYFDDFLMGIYVHNDRDSLEKMKRGSISILVISHWMSMKGQGLLSL